VTGPRFDHYRRAALLLSRALGAEVRETHFDRAHRGTDGRFVFSVDLYPVPFHGAGPDPLAALRALVGELRTAARGVLGYLHARTAPIERALDQAFDLVTLLSLEDPAAVCSCQREYALVQWEALPDVGPMQEPAFTTWLRRCVCQSTVSVVWCRRCEQRLSHADGLRGTCTRCDAPAQSEERGENA
jgi:hypothetical protein